MRIAFLAAVATILLIAAGCGGGGGAGAEPGHLEPQDAYLPLATGNWWEYEYRAPTVESSQGARIPDRATYRVLGPLTISGQEWFEVQVTEWVAADGIGDPVSQNTVYLRETREGVFFYEELNKIALQWLKRNASPGDTWQPEKDLGITWEMLDRHATADTQAGVFTGCLKVAEHDVYTSGSDQIEEVWERWFKQGVGMVMDRYWAEIPSSQQYPGLDPWDEHALLAYQVN
ncbi:MAG: hypothetical protein J7M26_01505 [Armatimonadetes bacterium]|nr:hypothetical protein [Armatimonadota bacterium]